MNKSYPRIDYESLNLTTQEMLKIRGADKEATRELAYLQKILNNENTKNNESTL